MEKVDLSKDYPQLFRASAKKVDIIEVPALQYLMISGAGAPEQSEDFQPAIETLYGIAYTLKFARKKTGKGPDFKIMPLEGIWWMKDEEDFDQSRLQDWRWTLMIAVPDFINDSELETAKQQLAEKKPALPVGRIHLDSYVEGKAVQMMHIGPYDKEQETIGGMMDFAESKQMHFTGHHHEIYMSDPRRVPPERLKTILRHPIAPTA